MACGSAYHVGVVAKYVLEQNVRIPVEVDVASEFRYRQPILGPDTLVLVISQSGETADTLAALREAKRLGSIYACDCQCGGQHDCKRIGRRYLYLGGPEIAVATTKAYSTQLAVVYLLTIYLADLLGKLTPRQYEDYIAELEALPDKMDAILKNRANIQYLASKFFNVRDVFFIGRNLDYAMSLEGSLKLKEISYIHSGRLRGRRA